MVMDDYLRVVTKQVKDRQVRREIEAELRSHLEDQIEAYIAKGMTEKEAEEEAVRQMGDPEGTGQEFNHIYPVKIDFVQAAGLAGIGVVLVLIRTLLQYAGTNFEQIAPVDILRYIGIAHDFREAAVLIITMISINVVIRNFIIHKRSQKEQKFLWQVGIAENNITFKGKVKFGDKTEKVQLKERAVKMGDKVMVVGIDGFTLIVESVESL